MQSPLVFGSIESEMKRFLSTLAGIALATVLLVGVSFAQAGEAGPLPQPTEPVNDFAGILRPETVERLNSRIRSFKEKTNPQVVIAVAVVRTTEGRDIFDYSLSVARGWKVGTDKEDNPSALLLIAVDDRKYFTQISRDLEDELPDGLAGQIQRKYLVPAFRAGDYDKGVSDTVEAYMATIAERSGMTGEFVGTTESASKGSGKGSKSSFCSGLIFFLIFIIFMLFGKRGGRGRRGGFVPVFVPFGSGGGGGGGWGGGGGGFGGFGGGDFGGGGAGGDW